ncbi:hypothetical protein H6P81_017994 [Aristolochia fimbriata]|uniref:Uncharacterized protein n=1 Tax=Aristolochia fimbriata TaxID=158543 RepID=A0AAV7DZQ8_ARIFI|nr:hypothetical protein H6P81_017994 [Aristolochia fimbriata]
MIGEEEKGKSEIERIWGKKGRIQKEENERRRKREIGREEKVRWRKGSKREMEEKKKKGDGGSLTETVRKKKLDIDVNPELLQFLNKELAGGERLVAHEFFLILAVCNTVIPIVTHRQSLSFMGSEFHEDAKAIDYQGESPDEQALVAAASVYGYTLNERTSSHIVVDVIGEKLMLDLQGLDEFDRWFWVRVQIVLCLVFCHKRRMLMAAQIIPWT